MFDHVLFVRAGSRSCSKQQKPSVDSSVEAGRRIRADRHRWPRNCDRFPPTFMRHMETINASFVVPIIYFFSEPIAVQLTPTPNYCFGHTDPTGTEEQKSK